MDIKSLISAKLNALNENYFTKKDSALEEVIESVKDMLINLRYSVKLNYKLSFFTNKLVDSLIQLKYEKSKPKDIKSSIAKLIREYDMVLLKELGIVKALKSIADGEDQDKTITKYLEKVEDNVKKLVEKYRKKIKDDKKYEIINSVNDDTDKITYNKFLKEKYFLQIELLKLQEWVVKNKKKVLVLFEGRDAAGKGSNIQSITEFLNPKYYRVETFGVPTDEEKENWFKRYEKVMPEEGEMVFFDRSWYNRGVIEPAMGYCTKTQYKDFMDGVCDWERKMIKDGVDIVKMWLEIDKHKQKVRFELRKRDPLRYWKFSENDGKILDKWDKLTPYIDKVLKKTNEEDVPWHIVNSDDKLGGILESMKTVLNQFDYDHKDHDILGTHNGLIFLDFHGVVITDIITDKDGGHDCFKGWDKATVDNVNQLTDRTKASIVVLSHCKDKMSYKELKKVMRENGITGNIVGRTVDIDRTKRAEQIMAWFEEHGKPIKWVILDDKEYDDYKDFPDELVMPHPKNGFTTNELESALKKFN